MTRRPVLAIDAQVVAGPDDRGVAALAELIHGELADRCHLLVADPASPEVGAVTDRLGLRPAQIHAATSISSTVDTIRRLRVTHLVHARAELHAQVDQVPIRLLHGAADRPVVPAGDPMAAVQPVADLRSAVHFLAMTLGHGLPDDLPHGVDVLAMSAPEASIWTRSWAPTSVISVVDEPADAIDTSAEQLIVCCRDVAAGFDAFQELQAWQIVDFLRLNADSDRILTHCRAGIGRSPAVAAAVRVATGAAPADAILGLLDQRPQARPNIHIVDIFDSVLGCDGELSNAARLLSQPWKPGARYR